MGSPARAALFYTCTRQLDAVPGGPARLPPRSAPAAVAELAVGSLGPLARTVELPGVKGCRPLKLAAVRAVVPPAVRAVAPFVNESPASENEPYSESDSPVID